MKLWAVLGIVVLSWWVVPYVERDDPYPRAVAGPFQTRYECITAAQELETRDGRHYACIEGDRL